MPRSPSPSTSTSTSAPRAEADALPSKQGEIGYPTVIEVPATPRPVTPPPPPATTPGGPAGAGQRCFPGRFKRARSFRYRHAYAIAWLGLVTSIVALVATSVGYGFCVRSLVISKQERQLQAATAMSANTTTAASKRWVVDVNEDVLGGQLLERGEEEDLRRRAPEPAQAVVPVRISAKRFHRRRRRRTPTDAAVKKRQGIQQAPGIVVIPSGSRPSSHHSEPLSAPAREAPTTPEAGPTPQLTAVAVPTSSTAPEASYSASASSSPETQSNLSQQDSDTSDPSSPIFVHALFILAILSEIIIIWKSAKKLWWAVIVRRRERAPQSASASATSGENDADTTRDAAGDSTAAGAGAGAGDANDEGMHPVELAEQRNRRSPTPTAGASSETKPVEVSGMTRFFNVIFGTPPPPTVVPEPRLPTYHAALGFSADGRRRLRGRRWRDGLERGTGDPEDLEVERNRRGGAPPAYNSDEQHQSQMLLSGPALRRALSVITNRFSLQPGSVPASRDTRRQSHSQHSRPSTMDSMHTATDVPTPDRLLSPSGSVRASVASFVGLVRRISVLGGPSPTSQERSSIAEEDEAKMKASEKRVSWAESVGGQGHRRSASQATLVGAGVGMDKGKGKATIAEQDEDDVSDAESESDKKTITDGFDVVAYPPPVAHPSDSMTQVRGVVIGSGMAARMSQRMQVQLNRAGSTSSMMSSASKRGRPPSLDLSRSTQMGAGSRTKKAEVIAIGAPVELDTDAEEEEIEDGDRTQR